MKAMPAAVQEQLREQLEKRLQEAHYVVHHKGNTYDIDFMKITLTLDVTEWTDLSDPEVTVGITTPGSQEKGHP